MNSKWKISRVGLVDFWYYDEEEFEFLDGRMLLRGANGSGKSVTMQSFIPLLLDGNMRPERLDPFGSRARKIENYLLEDGDGREERTGYLYMELKREASEEFATLGMGIRARRNKKLDSWYFCITDGRRVGKDIFLYKDVQSRIACTMRELKNRIGEGGKVMETQNEYARCVNRLLFGFETQEEYKELLELLIQLRTPKLSKDFKPTVINEILSSSLQTLSEDDLRPMSEAIENMDSLKTNLDTLNESIRAAEQIEKVYDQYNEIVLYDKALLFSGAVKKCAELSEKAEAYEKEITRCRKESKQEQERYGELCTEEKVLEKEKESLSDSDAARLKAEELRLRRSLEETENVIAEKKRQEQDKNEKRLEAEERRKHQAENNEQTWSAIEDLFEEMEGEIDGLAFDDFEFMRAELREKREEAYSFASHTYLLRDYTEKVERGREILEEENNCEERYSRFLQELDEYQNEKNQAERELLQYDNLLHETKQELIEGVYQWAHGNKELQTEPDLLKEISRKIEAYRAGSDYWEIRDLGKAAFDKRDAEIAGRQRENQWKLKEKREEAAAAGAELEEWKNKKEPEPERSEAVQRNRCFLDENEIPYLPFYKAVDFVPELDGEKRARLEEALLNMGILDALIVPDHYRQRVLEIDPGMCDRYIFTDAARVKKNLTSLFDIENAENDIILYQNVSAALASVGILEDWMEGGAWICENGNYRIGVLEGTVTKNYTPCFIGASAREQYRMKKIGELEEQCRSLDDEIRRLEEEAAALEERRILLKKEWDSFPDGQDLKLAAKELEKCEDRLSAVNEKIRRQKELTEEARRALDEIRQRAQEISRKVYLAPRLDIFAEALKSLHNYREKLAQLQVAHGNYRNGVSYVKTQEAYLEDIDGDLDDIRYDLGRAVNSRRETERTLASVLSQLALTDYEKIKERLEYCVNRLTQIPMEKEASVRKQANLQNTEADMSRRRQENQVEAAAALRRKQWLEEVFSGEYALNYVKRDFVLTEDAKEQAVKICGMFAGRFGNRKQSDLLGSLQEEFHKNRGYLLEYQITLKTLFAELDEETSFDEISVKRIDISAKYRGTAVKFKELLSVMREDAEMQKRLLSEKDRELFEDILANTISKKIRSRIQSSKRWVEKMNALMESMRTSSGLTLSLRWKSRRAEKEEQLDTSALVDLLQKDAEIMRVEEAEQLSRHFRSKIEEARKGASDAGNTQSFHAIMREVLDYRQWFEFQLECRKTGEKKKELTDRVFFTFSGGEKAMAMYVPLFSAVVAKYDGARSDAPRLISLDEAFAGVDEMNIRDMFRLMTEFDFNYMINSQILWGDYDTVPGLAIYQLVRPENVKYVTVIRYIWNGKVRKMLGSSIDAG